ncbi:calcium-binding protein [Sedimentitalea sp.]|uniref:calcium-binding protein n=1 Tax=Sedimentitalea sp. TaxID=2048915 RepID=UPI0032994C8E
MAVVNLYTATDFFDTTARFYGSITAATGSLVRVADSYGNRNDYTGSFYYDWYGYLTGGVVREFDAFSGGSLTVTVTGLNLPALDAASAVLSGDFSYVYRKGLDGADTIFGSPFADKIRGFSGDDEVDGGAGADSLYGELGRDVLQGGAGADKLYGGGGADSLYGGGASDTLNGGKGNDTLNGGNSADSLYGGVGRDELNGGKGNDELFGGNDADSLYGGVGRDELNGGKGNDELFGGVGADSLHGGAGKDTLNGGKGNDILSGGKGADHFVFNNKSGKDSVLDFQNDTDTLMLDEALWGGGLTKKQMLNNYASVVDGDIVLDFGQDELRIEDFTNINALRNDIEFI